MVVSWSHDARRRPDARGTRKGRHRRRSRRRRLVGRIQSWRCDWDGRGISAGMREIFATVAKRTTGGADGIVPCADAVVAAGRAVQARNQRGSMLIYLIEREYCAFTR